MQPKQIFFFFLTSYFKIISDLQNCLKNIAEFPYNFLPVSPNVNIWHTQDTISNTRKLALKQFYYMLYRPSHVSFVVSLSSFFVVWDLIFKSPCSPPIWHILSLSLPINIMILTHSESICPSGSSECEFQLVWHVSSDYILWEIYS